MLGCVWVKCRAYSQILRLMAHGTCGSHDLTRVLGVQTRFRRDDLDMHVPFTCQLLVRGILWMRHIQRSVACNSCGHAHALTKLKMTQSICIHRDQRSSSGTYSHAKMTTSHTNRGLSALRTMIRKRMQTCCWWPVTRYAVERMASWYSQHTPIALPSVVIWLACDR